MVSKLLKKVKIHDETDKEIWRLSGLLKDDASAIAKRGGSSIAKSALSAIGAVLTVADYVKTPFVPRIGPKPYGESRFSDGRWPVFYAAEDFKTTLSEVKFHMRSRLRPGFPARLLAFTCEFSGNYAMLLGLEIKYPLLTQRSSTSYPYCQEVAQNLRLKALGLRTRSARRPSGVCRPVFSEFTLSHGLERRRVELTLVGRRVLTRVSKL